MVILSRCLQNGSYLLAISAHFGRLNELNSFLIISSLMSFPTPTAKTNAELAEASLKH